MSFLESLDGILREVSASEAGGASQTQRIRTEIDFAQKFAELFPDKTEKWQKLILKAATLLKDRFAAGGSLDICGTVKEAEDILAPIGKAAKDYTIHCCGHAHIDMNWMWPWQETISVSHDTFATVDRLMDEFPDFQFSQSQASTYIGMEEFCPEIFEMIKKRIAEGRWEVTASQWVEGDKNIASGEILCRHILYTKRYLKEKFGIDYNTVKIDWEADTFGHAYTLPGILNKGGVSRYYFHRTGPHKWLFWWKSPDGSKVLAFRDKLGYNGQIEATVLGPWFVDYVKETNLKNWMYLYGVGDHGGGPTRRDLMKAIEIDKWPIFPNVKLSTTDKYFSAVEAENTDNLFVQDDELNYVFEGCYTSETNIKLANRVSENILPEVEAISLVAGAGAGFPYPSDELKKAWRMAMFNQFHDILPGSGIRETYQYAQGLFQEIQATTGAIRTRALRQLSKQINTSAGSGKPVPTGTLGASIGDGLGGGAGDPGLPGGVSGWNAGAVSAEPVIIFNQLGFPRSEVVFAKVWNKEFPANLVSVRNDKGDITSGQVVETGHYWGHVFTTVAFPAKDIPATGYSTFTIDRTVTPVAAEGVKMTEVGVMENEYLRVEVDGPSGAIKHLIDKKTGYDFVPAGKLSGVLEYCLEIPHGMTAWDIGQISRIEVLDQDGWWMDKPQVYSLHQDGGIGFGPWGHGTLPKVGPHRASMRFGRKLKDSTIWTEIGLDAGSKMVDFRVYVEWREIGSHTKGVPMLRIAFPTNVTDATGTYEIPFGSIKRPANGQEVPALKWADISGKQIGAKGVCGLTVVNSHKYGHNAEGDTLRVSLIRSSYDPDTLPEIGKHDIKLAIMPHMGECDVTAAQKAGDAFNLAMNVVSTDIHEGPLASTKGFAESLTPNVMLASIKKAEDCDCLIVRVYETEGKAVTAKVQLDGLVKSGCGAIEVDIVEQPLAKSSAKMTGTTLSVKLPAHSVVTVKVG
ncbi:MAG: alpha-mannosidase [Armatimonadota bacterium]